MKNIITFMACLLVASGSFAQGVTKHGEKSSSGDEFVDEHGRVVSDPALNKHGEILTPDIPELYELTITPEPAEGGVVSGQGEYPAGEQVSITATVNSGWKFVNWTGDTDHLDDLASANTTVTMPAQSVLLTANFQEDEDYEFICGDHVTFSYSGETATYGTIFRGGLCWFDRNLGAEPLPFAPSDDAAESNDSRLYGDLFQWGRGEDGHQMVTWTSSTDGDFTPTTSTLSTSNDPGHSKFIRPGSSPMDWRSPQNDDLWQGTAGINNPCPTGWRVPTETELNGERQSWSTNDRYGAFESTLKWPLEGARAASGPNLTLGSWGFAWSSSVSGSRSRILIYFWNDAKVDNYGRAVASAVRCVSEDFIAPAISELNLESNPTEGGTLYGEGQFPIGEEVSITATAYPGWVFVNWTGDTDYVNDPHAPNAIVTIPEQNISLTAIFQQDDDFESDCGDPITFIYRDEEVTYGTIFRVGLCWLDRNLGAEPMPFLPAEDASGNTDSKLYGDLFQWGRPDDGHQDKQSATIAGPVNSDVPGHGDFITVSSAPHDWRLPQNNFLWQGGNDANNPCPPGYRIPTETELNAERMTWNSNDAQGAYASDLKWPVGGYRLSEGSPYFVGMRGFVWSSSVNESRTKNLYYHNSNANIGSNNRVTGRSVRCVRDDYVNLNLYNEPVGGGTVSGQGPYEEGEQVSINAETNWGWQFLEWTGDTDYVDDPASANTTVTMPAQNVSLTANYQKEDDPGINYGDGVTDIDSNEYVTVIIGNQEWMAENLRVSKYNNGDAISTGLSDADWENTTEGAYAIYPHVDFAEGINSDEEMVEAYGKLYNWYAVDDARGLCPEGWSVPSDADWTQLVDYVVDQGYPNDDVLNGAGNALKSCRQVNHPDGGDCDTSEHPRWASHGTHFGFDEFGFSALPGGLRLTNGSFSGIAGTGYWWSSTEAFSASGWSRYMNHHNGAVNRSNGNRTHGYSLRCIRD